MSAAAETLTKTYTAKALDAELGRRKNNKGRDKKVRAQSFVLPALSKANIDTIKAGESVTITFGSGRVVNVGLKSVAA